MKSVLNILWKDWWWSLNSNTLATWSEELIHCKNSVARKDWRQEKKGMTEDEMVGWHHWFDGHEFEVPGVGDGPGSLVCCSPLSHKELDSSEWLNWTELDYTDCLFMVILIENWTYCFLQGQHNSVWPHECLFLNICISEFLDNWITYSVNESLHIWRDELNNSFMLIFVFVKSSCIILKIALAIQGFCVSIQKYTFFLF